MGSTNRIGMLVVGAVSKYDIRSKKWKRGIGRGPASVVDGECATLGEESHNTHTVKAKRFGR